MTGPSPGGDQSWRKKIGQGECTRNLQDQCRQESGPFNLGQGECTTNLQGHRRRRGGGGEEEEEKEEGEGGEQAKEKTEPHPKG